MFLENEAFTLCPVSVQFTLFDLPEFYFLKNATDSFEEENTRVCHVSSVEQLGLGDALDYVLIPAECKTVNHDDEPFRNAAPDADPVKLVAETRHQTLSIDRSSSEESW